jgi:hypothetical protein
LAFEGRPAADFTLAELRELLRQPARKYRLRVRRGEALVQVELKTRRLV